MYTTNKMKFWCYFLSHWKSDILDKISDICVITTPTKHKITLNDTIFLYNRLAPYGFIGYVRVGDDLLSNINGSGECKYEIFDDKTFNNFYAKLKFDKFLENPIDRKDIFGDNKDLHSEFAKKMRVKEQIIQVSDEIGIIVKKYIKNFKKSTNGKDKVEKENMEKKSKRKNNNKKREEEKIETKSHFIIPIMIIPCKNLRRDVLEYDDNGCTGFIFKHVSNCKKCDLTNNNDRVSLNMINSDIPYYEMIDTDEISTLLNTYHSLKYYKTKHCRVIKIMNDESDYFGCFCIIGRLDKKY